MNPFQVHRDLYVFSAVEQPSSSGDVHTNEIPEDLLTLVLDDGLCSNNMDHFLYNTKFTDVWDTEKDRDIDEPL